MARAAVSGRRREVSTLTPFEKAVWECETLMQRGCAELALASLDTAGGEGSPDPRIQYLAACCHLACLRYGKAKDLLARARAGLEAHPQWKAAFAGTPFARLDEAIALLEPPLVNEAMPALLASPIEFLRNPAPKWLQIAGRAGAGVGRISQPLKFYRAPSLVAQEGRMAEGPPRIPPPPKLTEPIQIRDDSIRIIAEPIQIVTEAIQIRTYETVTSTPGGAAAALPPPPQRPRVSASVEGVVSRLAHKLQDKRAALEMIQGLMAGGQVKEALVLAQQATARFPQSATVRETYARILDHQGKAQQAASAYLATAHIALSSPERRGRVERSLLRAVQLAPGDLGLLRDVLATARRAGLVSVEKSALETLLRLESSISDPMVREVWRRRLHQIDPGNEMAHSAESAGRSFARPAAWGDAGGPPSAGAPSTPAPTASPMSVWSAEGSAVISVPDYEPIGPPPMMADTAPPPAESTAPAALAPPAVSAAPAAAPAPPFVPAVKPPETEKEKKPAWPGKASASPAAPPKPAVAPAPPWEAVRPPAAAPPISPAAPAPPLAAPGLEGASFPCFYCGDRMPAGEEKCPKCGHQQPRFLREGRAAPPAAAGSPDFLSARERARAEEIRRAGKAQPKSDANQVIMIIALLLTVFGWVFGSSVLCFIALGIASGVKKSPSASPGLKTFASVLKFFAGIGCVLGLFRGKTPL